MCQEAFIPDFLTLLYLLRRLFLIGFFLISNWWMSQFCGVSVFTYKRYKEYKYSSSSASAVDGLGQGERNDAAEITLTDENSRLSIRSHGWKFLFTCAISSYLWAVTKLGEKEIPHHKSVCSGLLPAHPVHSPKPHSRFLSQDILAEVWAQNKISLIFRGEKEKPRDRCLDYSE